MNNKLACDNISMKMEAMEYLYLVDTSGSVNKLQTENTTQKHILWHTPI